MLSLATPPDWCEILRQNFTDWRKLCDFLEIEESKRDRVLRKARFPLNLPLRLAKKVVKNDLEDPILRQFLPIDEELRVLPNFRADPVCDLSFQEQGKLLRKYEGRVLLLATSACAMHCRFCFRQNFPYETQRKGYEAELDLIAGDTSIKEVILSGGDPLSLSNGVLAYLLQSLSFIPHVRRIRFHTRFPVGIPERIDMPFLDMIGKLPQQVFFVLHANHARELDEEIFDSLKTLRKLGVTVLNQHVLLKGVNNTVDALCELYEKLVDNGIMPYYLHQLDRVQGAGHFEVPQEEGKWLLAQAAARLPGYAVPKYVSEIAGENGKTPIT